MTAPHHVALRALSTEFASMSQQMARMAQRLNDLDRVLDTAVTPQVPAPHPVAPPPVVAQQMPPPAAAPPIYPVPQPVYPTPPAYPPVHIPQPHIARPPAQPRPTLATRLTDEDRQGWISKVLAVSGVAVTLIGVALLLVLAAQAGILRPEIRVGAGALLAGALVAVGVRLNRRPGGRIGAIALTATGIAAAYIDVVAVTTVYGWLDSVPGLLLAAAIGAAGLSLARRWDSQHLALLVLVPLTVLAPIVADGVTLVLLGFMIALSAASLPAQLGKDWTWMYAARTAATTVPLLLALLMTSFSSALSGTPKVDTWLLGAACGVAALLAVIGALLLLPRTSNRAALALLTVVGVLPVLVMGIAVDRTLAALGAAAVAVAMLAVVLLAGTVPGVAGIAAKVWSALSAVAAVIAITTAFDGYVQGPVLLGLALITAVVGRSNASARWAATGFAALGGLVYLSYAPPEALLRAIPISTGSAVSTLASSLLLTALALVLARAWTAGRVIDDGTKTLWVGSAVIAMYAVTMFTVTAGVLLGGTGGGFLAGHMVATICWVVLAAGLFVLAHRMPADENRALPLGAGLALTIAAMAKLFLFDLGTLDGMFRVVVFIVVGLILLAMGASYARSLSSKGLPHQS